MDEWILDSGSSSHMTNKNLFKEIQKRTSEIQTAKKSETLASKGIGTIETNKCILEEVLYVENLNKIYCQSMQLQKTEEK